VTAAEYGRRFAIIDEARRAAGRDRAPFVATQTLLVGLGDSHAQVLEQAMGSLVCAAMALGAPAAAWSALGLTHPLGADHGGALDLVPSRVGLADVQRAQATMRPELLTGQFYLGSADEICAEVAPLVDAGCRHLIVVNVGASFTGEGARGLWRFAQLMRRLRRI
jgi:hypothetical protein